MNNNDIKNECSVRCAIVAKYYPCTTKNISKICGFISSSIPGPSSVTLIFAFPSSLHPQIQMVDPGGVYLMALSIRFFRIDFAMAMKRERFGVRSREVFCTPIGRMCLSVCGMQIPAIWWHMISLEGIWKAFAASCLIWRIWA